MRKLLTAATLAATFAIAASPAGAAGSRSISLLDGRIQPPLLTVRQWQVVTWTNDGREAHGVSSDGDAALASGALDPGSAFATLFRQAGTFRYHDPLHPGLVGTIVVLAAPRPAVSGPTPPSGTLPPGFEPVARTVRVAAPAAHSPRRDESGIAVGWVGFGAAVLVASGGAVALAVRRRRGGTV